MKRSEIFIGGTHHVQIPILGLLSGKIIEQIGKYFICKEDGISGGYYLISPTGKLQIFPIEGGKVPEIDQHFTDGIFILEDKSPNIPRIMLFKEYTIENDLLLLIDAIHKQKIVLSIN